MNSSLFHRKVQLELSYVQWNVYDEAFLELGSIRLSNLDQDLRKDVFVFDEIVEKIIYLLRCAQRELLSVQIMTRYVDYVHFVHQVIEEDLPLLR